MYGWMSRPATEYVGPCVVQAAYVEARLVVDAQIYGPTEHFAKCGLTETRNDRERVEKKGNTVAVRVQVKNFGHGGRPVHTAEQTVNCEGLFFQRWTAQFCAIKTAGAEQQWVVYLFNVRHIEVVERDLSNNLRPKLVRSIDMDAKMSDFVTVERRDYTD